ncbi:alpha/beta hydrolase [Actinomycetes bacterium KLBMP 9797]
MNVIALTVVVAAATLAGAAVDAAPASAGAHRFHQQRVAWHGCQHGPEDQVGADLDAAGAQCGEVTVPLDYARPGGRTITVAMSRLPAADPTRRIGVLLLNGGGPGGIGLDMPLLIGAQPIPRERFDLIGMDPRFVGRSTPLDCGWPTSSALRSAGADRRAFDRITAFEADLAARCAARHGDVLPYVSTRNTARDMDVIRAVLGEEKLSYFGYSYGTYLGAVYTQMFPDRADRVVLDGAVDPEGYGPRMLRDNGPTAAAALRDWAGWTAARHDRYGLGDTTERVLAAVAGIHRAAVRRPLAVGGYAVDQHLLPMLLFSGLYDDRDAPSAEFAAAVRVLRDAAAGRPVTPTPALEEELRFATTGADSHYGSVQMAIICGDRAAPRNPETYWRDIQAHRTGGSLFEPFTRNLNPCAFWPEPPRERPTRISNDVPALIVQSTGDPATLYRYAQAMHRALPASRLLTLDARIHAVYANYGNACVDGQVNAYLASGVLPGTDRTCLS